MTDKERDWVQKRHLSEKDTLGVLALKLFRKELVKKLNKKGYALDKKELVIDKVKKGVYLDIGEPNPPLYVPVISDFDAWGNGKESVLKVYGKSKNKNAQRDGKTWVKSVKDILKEYDRYAEPAEEREEM